MNRYEKALMNLDRFLSKNSIKYAIIGGIAVIIHGAQRTTKDIDATILCELEGLDSVHQLILEKFKPAFNGTLEYFKRNFILPVDEPETDLRIDLAAGLTEFDKNVISRRKKMFFGNVQVYVCSLEDLIIYKLFASRRTDLDDVELLLNKNINTIDKSYLIETSEKFSELEREDIIENLNKFLQAAR